MANKQSSNLESIPPGAAQQACIKSVLNLRNPALRKRMISFIKRNLIPDCQRVAPNCLKAHLLNEAKSLKLPKRKIEELKSLFKSKIGYDGYYLDSGKLKRTS
ncbi:hypothetical protein CO155_00880 [Candidatus Pacearchaeota archaeon CG_4_9_14_3_um_filter_35_19]|nr:hypothetical protein [Candidatus Pacearchaeota archaeon]PJA70179.1 MAG: hypothetical protein CO155_00880 [Candidatus Pacearchaeota archaeon CG_4_9_14_3_um_filter_35_19]PJB93929.1 MAG: hypothetical protein CO081_03655 [Candidatus Pacearchaeota archaeon CG_4_9_14_0_8_um_filter_35_24]